MANRLLGDVSGTLDATGKGSIATQPVVGSWSKITLALSTSKPSSPQWTIGVGKGSGTIGVHQVDFCIGNPIRTGPFLIAPGEVLVATITNGSPNDNIQGTYYGLQDLTPSEFTSDAVISTSSYSSSPQVLLSTISDTALTGVQSSTVTVPPGTHLLCVVLDANSWNWTQLSIVGGDSNYTYYFQNPATDGQLMYWFPIPQVLESKWIINVNRISGGLGLARIIAIFDVSAVILATQGQAALRIAPPIPGIANISPGSGGVAHLAQSITIVASPVTLITSQALIQYFLDTFIIKSRVGVANSVITLQDNVPHVIWTSNLDQIVDKSFPLNGLALPNGSGLFLVASGVDSPILDVSCIFRQARIQ